MSRHALVVSGFILLGVILPGCSDDGPELSLHEPGSTHPQLPVVDVAANTDLSVPAVAIDAPFPNRANPFKRQSQESGQVVSIRVAGFTHEGGMARTVLLIDEQVAVMSQDEEWRGVRIRKIAPPVVVVQQNGIEKQLFLTGSPLEKRVLR